MVMTVLLQIGLGCASTARGFIMFEALIPVLTLTLAGSN